MGLTTLWFLCGRAAAGERGCGMSLFSWEKVDPAPGVAVAPHQRLSWGKTAGLGAQHVVAMFGATFVFPLVMGLYANLPIMMSGIATICFLLIVRGRVPSYLGTSAAFVGAASAIYAQSGGPADVTGAILVSGVVLALVGVGIHFAGPAFVNKLLPPIVTGDRKSTRLNSSHPVLSRMPSSA